MCLIFSVVKIRAEYRAFREAGADRNLWHEAADKDHYRILHPENSFTGKTENTALRHLKRSDFRQVQDLW